MADVKVYQDNGSLTVADSDSFPLGEFSPLCDIPKALAPEVCIDRSFDCAKAVIMVVPENWWRGVPVTEFEERSDYGYHLEDDPSCDLSTGFYLMLPQWVG